MSTIIEAPPLVAPDEQEELALNRQAALAWAQEHGYEGADLPKGRPYAASGCVMARALGGQVSTLGNTFARWWYPRDQSQGIPLPWRVSRFTYDFDARMYPDLIEE